MGFFFLSYLCNPSMSKEASARIKINKLLEQSGWRLLDDEKGKANVELEGNVRLDSLGDDYEHLHSGFIDYLLRDSSGFPLCILEAKSESKDPLDGKEQARRYAQGKGKNCRFIILSNGNMHYFWDLEQGNPTGISRFPSSEDLERHQKFEPDPSLIWKEKIDADYIALSQRHDYASDPRWVNQEKRADFIDRQNFVSFVLISLKQFRRFKMPPKKGRTVFS